MMSFGMKMEKDLCHSSYVRQLRRITFAPGLPFKSGSVKASNPSSATASMRQRDTDLINWPAK
eukprot:CAMPEP_0197696924 /NCGR_PEP_ID=MMETSP1338-20131121/117279_1 /TAXON_ID=43686 ORGANISM="Pelagodinium beii, Strain RCC1491" /NCGR_SAMPLE_ID=MMETSP1338 /ASSEMBLY_ACC=CAM_ASM_000754 /LENGTH=62 /DNA_ID=CAMNT_0043280113 /DNA_START=486 /DNA_END=671 /DNA_ORIENTATION=-